MVLQPTNGSSAAASMAKRSGRQTKKQKVSVTENRARAQRAKQDTQTEARRLQQEEQVTPQIQKKTGRQALQAKRRTIETLIEAYIQDHIGGNRSKKTIEWHQTALGLFRLFLETLEITQIDEIESEDIRPGLRTCGTRPDIVEKYVVNARYRRTPVRRERFSTGWCIAASSKSIRLILSSFLK